MLITDRSTMPRAEPPDQAAASGRRESRDAAAVAAALVAFGAELAASGAAQTGDAFTDDAEADAFLKADPAAFLIGVLFTQGIPAERAWAGPYRLARRLGHFDLARIARDPDGVAAAVAAPPALHRFVRTLPGWIVAAAREVEQRWDGDASGIWADGADARSVLARLETFPGIGRKKAAMAVEILARHFGVPIPGMECGRVAYDVHVRRVFLRSGLVAVDSPEAVEAAAVAACPQAPGTVDLPAWLVGRLWCRPAAPRCDECRLGAVCPRLTTLGVDGVGVRRTGRAVASGQ